MAIATSRAPDAEHDDEQSAIVQAYRAKTPTSARMAAEAQSLFPSGVTHDVRYMTPHGLYIERAEGPHKWDVDGHRYVDYFGGHGALLLGHNHPEVGAAIQEALTRGTHFGAGHEAEIRWAKKVIELVPSAERVRFTSSGTEATLMALRLSRAHTGRTRILRFRGHFHGWHDDMTAGFMSHFDGTPVIGVAEAVARNSVLADANDVDGLRDVMKTEGHSLAAVILEPLGAGTGMAPIDRSFLETLRELTAEHGVVLIFDEVITGFRVAPGGVQEASGVTPDLTTMAKIVAGGLPGGAVAGRKEILDGLDFKETARQGREKVFHPGTFNANPVSAAAGAKALEVLTASQACAQAADTTRHLREELNGVLLDEAVPWAVYGQASIFHIFMNPEGRALSSPHDFRPEETPHAELQTKPPQLKRKLHLAMLVNGVDLSGWPGGLLSSSHGAEDVAATAQAFRESLRMLKNEGLL